MFEIIVLNSVLVIELELKCLAFLLLNKLPQSCIHSLSCTMCKRIQMFRLILFAATMVTGRSEQRRGRSRAAGYFIARPVHGRFRLRRREPQRGREVLLWQAERDHGQKRRFNVATGLRVHEGESRAVIYLNEENFFFVRKTCLFIEISLSLPLLSFTSKYDFSLYGDC